MPTATKVNPDEYVKHRHNLEVPDDRIGDIEQQSDDGRGEHPARSDQGSQSLSQSTDINLIE